MAEDLMIGFKFYDREDNNTRDSEVKLEAETLFTEIGFATTKGHLGTEETSAKILEDTRDFDPADQFDSFDFSEGFDFIM